jgi:hypothetical protein
MCDFFIERRSDEMDRRERAVRLLGEMNRRCADGPHWRTVDEAIDAPDDQMCRACAESAEQLRALLRSAEPQWLGSEARAALYARRDTLATLRAKLAGMDAFVRSLGF